MQEHPWDEWKTEIINTINSIELINDPFHYFYIEPFLPAELYKMLDIFWPSSNCFWGQDEISYTPLYHKEANLRKVVIIDDTPELSSTEEGKLFWSKFRDLIRQPILSKVFIARTEAYIKSVRKDIIDTPIKYFSNALLEDDTIGFELGPHIDSEKNLLSLLLYLPDANAPENMGTCVYKPNTQFCIDNPSIGYQFNGEYFKETDFELTYRAPYRANALFGLINEPRAYHGVKKIENNLFRRRHIQWMITQENTSPDPAILSRIKNGVTPKSQRVERRLQELLNKKR